MDKLKRHFSSSKVNNSAEEQQSHSPTISSPESKGSLLNRLRGISFKKHPAEPDMGRNRAASDTGSARPMSMAVKRSSRSFTHGVPVGPSSVTDSDLYLLSRSPRIGVGARVDHFSGMNGASVEPASPATATYHLNDSPFSFQDRGYLHSSSESTLIDSFADKARNRMSGSYGPTSTLSFAEFNNEGGAHDMSVGLAMLQDQLAMHDSNHNSASTTPRSDVVTPRSTGDNTPRGEFDTNGGTESPRIVFTHGHFHAPATESLAPSSGSDYDSGRPRTKPIKTALHDSSSGTTVNGQVINANPKILSTSPGGGTSLSMKWRRSSLMIPDLRKRSKSANTPTSATAFEISDEAVLEALQLKGKLSTMSSTDVIAHEQNRLTEANKFSPAMIIDSMRRENKLHETYLTRI